MFWNKQLQKKYEILEKKYNDLKGFVSKNQPYIRLVANNHKIWLDVWEKLAKSWFKDDFIKIIESAQKDLQNRSLKELYSDKEYAQVRQAFLCGSYSSYSVILDSLRGLISSWEKTNNKKKDSKK